MEEEFDKLEINILNTLPLSKRLYVSNHYQGRPARYICTICGKEKMASVYILFDKGYNINGLLCYKCHSARKTLKKLGPVMAKKLERARMKR